MTILDAFAVHAFLDDEPAAADVEALLRTRDARLTATGVAEVIDRLMRVKGASATLAAGDLAQLRLLEPVPVDRSIGAAAGRLRARRYHRRTCALSLADCVGAEAARSVGEPLATADPALLRVCHDEGIGYVALAATDGSVWRS